MESRTLSKRVSKEEVIAKLKDDGDFDNLRLNIIRKLKHSEDFRNSIVSIVRHSTALNRSGAENMKPRQLSDAIYGEVGSELMSKLSEGIWGVIRSEDGVKNEITETVQSVYNKLVYPEKKEVHGPSTRYLDMHKVNSEDKFHNLSDIEPEEPPGFSLSNNQNHQEPNIHSDGTKEEQKQGPDLVTDAFDSDEDPEVPPGFG